MAYLEEFIQALERTKSFRLPIADCFLKPTLRLLSNDKQDYLYEAIMTALGNPDPEELDANCLNITSALVQPISELFGVEALFTLGWLDLGDGDSMFRFDETYIQNTILKGHKKGAKKHMHAWLTLPSMEIIDATIATSLAKRWKQPNWQRQILAEHADSMNGIIYKPMLVGTSFLEIESPAFFILARFAAFVRHAGTSFTKRVRRALKGLL
jgi:hypothetical protein